MNQLMVGPASPFFIVRDVLEAVDYYQKCLGFELRMLAPDDNPFFAVVGRGNAQLLLKSVSDDVRAQPNPSRHKEAAWDAFIFVNTPKELEAEVASNAALILKSTELRHDGLQGFTVRDMDGYVLFFGCPV